MPLSATQVKNVKPEEKPIKLSDGGGLYLFVKPTGSKLWRMNYRHLGRQKTASFGPYPSVSLAEAREHREEAKRVLRSGMDPVEHAQATKEAATKALRAQEDVTTPTFEALSLSFIAKRTREKASPKTLEKYDWLHRLTLPEVGHLNPMEIEPPNLRPLLLRLEVENKLDTAQRTRAYIGQVMRHGIAAGLASRDPSPDLRGLVASPKTKNHAAIKDPKLFGEFLNTCDEYTGNPVTVLAMQIAPLVALRSEELRCGTWDEIDFDAAIWRVPQHRMKGDCPGDHLVPLSKQALGLLRKLHLITGRRKNMFETVNTPGISLSENTINQAYRRMGFPKEVVTLHGVRTTFSTFTNEQTVGEGEDERRRFDKDWIERQLSHIDSSVRGTYNAAEYIGPRRGMMQWLADHYDHLAGR